LNLKTLLDQLKDEAEQQIKFSETLYQDGDKLNSHFQEGHGKGVLTAIREIEKVID